MEKRIVLEAFIGLIASVIIGVVIFFRNYTRYAKQKDWEDVTRGLNPEELAAALAKRDLKEAKEKTWKRRRMGAYIAISIAIVLYLSLAI
jgi:hypothetical protein